MYNTRTVAVAKHEQSRLTQQPSTSDAPQLQLQKKINDISFERIPFILFLQSIIGGITITIKRCYHVKHLYYRR
jgi:hypothetical protein